MIRTTNTLKCHKYTHTYAVLLLCPIWVVNSLCDVADDQTMYLTHISITPHHNGKPKFYSPHVWVWHTYHTSGQHRKYHVTSVDHLVEIKMCARNQKVWQSNIVCKKHFVSHAREYKPNKYENEKKKSKIVFNKSNAFNKIKYSKKNRMMSLFCGTHPQRNIVDVCVCIVSINIFIEWTYNGFFWVSDAQNINSRVYGRKLFVFGKSILYARGDEKKVIVSWQHVKINNDFREM